MVSAFVVVAFHLVVGMADILDDCIEARLVVGVVLNDAFSAVSFVQRVFAFDDISVAVFPVAVNISSLWIVDAVFKLVGWMVMRLLSVLAFTSMTRLRRVCSFDVADGSGRHCGD